MDYTFQLNKAFEGATHLPLTPDSRYVLMSDCHRGCGSFTDPFLQNQNLFHTALSHYYQKDFTYIELGDGDELWQNRSLSKILDTHKNIFDLMKKFYQEHRLYLLYGNHDYVKSRPRFVSPFPGLPYLEGLILDITPGSRDVCLAHGHQADYLNSRLWKLARFMVRYLWHPVEYLGIADPTSASKNNARKKRIEQKLLNWATQKHAILITGHTHQPRLNKKIPYLNTGSCIHPERITAIEIRNHAFILVEWSYCTKEDFTVTIQRKVLAGPVCVNDY